MQQAGLYPLLKIVASDTYIYGRIGINHTPRVRDIIDALCLLSIHICNVSKYTSLIQSCHNVLVAIETSCAWSRSGSELIHGTVDGCRHYLAIPEKPDFCSSVFPLPSSVETACVFQPPLLQTQQLMSVMSRPPQFCFYVVFLALGILRTEGKKIKIKILRKISVSVPVTKRSTGTPLTRCLQIGIHKFPDFQEFSMRKHYG